jgi:phosphoribosylanthranilate isomerase
MSAVKVKICGLTRVDDVIAAVTAGADLIGFVFTASPRRVSIGAAIELAAHIPDRVLSVGLFLNQEMSEIKRVIKAVPLDVLQFHGSEREAECGIYGLPYLKAVAMQSARSAEHAEYNYPSAMGLLLDSHAAGKPGGSGKVFDWSLYKPVAKPVWLAGGLNVENVGRAVRAVKPFAVDVSSGVESAPGIKDAERMAAFISAARSQEVEESK